MASNNKLYLNVGNLLALSPGDMDADDSSPRFRPGGLNFLSDAYGARIMKYVQARATAIGKADLVSAASGGTDQRHTAFTVQATVVNATTAADITGATADRHIGMIAFVNDDAGAAGAAPEGEATIVRSNTATVMRFEADYALSAALAVNDVLHVIATYQVEAAAAADQAWVVEGVAIGDVGFAANNYGWVQQYGHAMARMTAAAITLGNEVVAGASAVLTKGSQTGEDWVGVALASVGSDQVAVRVPIKITIFGNRSGIAA